MAGSRTDDNAYPSEAKTLGQAWKASPGPRSPVQAFLVGAKGFAMGSADIIPGVSGGTIAFITNIYDELVLAIRSVDLDFIRRLARLDLPGALAGVHIRFLLALMTGILLAILSMARLMNYLLHHHPEQTWSLFFGLILASVVVVGRRIPGLGAAQWAVMAVFAAGGYALVGMIPLQTPTQWWFIFASGALAICAMILPGISGAFILLILGKYEFITATLKNPLDAGNLAIIAVFCAGCAVGVIVFSRILSYLLTRHRAVTLSALTGLMIGALRKIWPWKEMAARRVAEGEVEVLAQVNVLPAEVDRGLVVALGLMILGFVVVFMLERFSGRLDEDDSV